MSISPSASSLVRQPVSRGLARGEAGNVVAGLDGLRPVPGGWTGREIDHLRFVLQADSRSTPTLARPAGVTAPVTGVTAPATDPAGRAGPAGPALARARGHAR